MIAAKDFDQIKVPTIRIWFEIKRTENTETELKSFGYKGEIPETEIIALPIDFKINDDEYGKDSTYFDELTETIVDIIMEPSYGILNIKSDDSRIKELAELMIRCFDSSEAIRL